MFRHRGGWRRTSRRTVEAVLTKPLKESKLYSIKLPEKSWLFVIKLPEKARQFVIKEPEELEKLMKLAGEGGVCL